MKSNGYTLKIRRAAIALAVAGAMASSAGASAAVIDVEWSGGTTGNWATAGNWTPAAAPNNGASNYNVSIDKPGQSSAVSLTAITNTVDSLRIGAGSQFSFSAFSIAQTGFFSTFTINRNAGNAASGIVNNAGKIMVTGQPSTVAIAALQFTGGASTLTGGGEIELSGPAFLDTQGAGNSLTNVNNRIHGEGAIGLAFTGGSDLLVTNQSAGVIEADKAGKTLFATNIVNQGLMKASNGGTLSLQGGTVDNSGGLILSDGAGSIANLTATVKGGTIQSTNGGALKIDAGSAGTFDGVTLNGALSVGSQAILGLANTVTNNSVITLAGGATTAGLRVVGADATLAGGGEVKLGGTGFQAVLGSQEANRTFTNQDNYIHGSGFFGADQVGIVNRAAGRIEADIAGQTLWLDPGALGMVNEGTLKAVNGGKLELRPGTYTNTGQTILADGAGSGIVLNAATVVGGTLKAVNGATMTTVNNGNGSVSTLDNVTLDGTLKVDQLITLTAKGTLDNTAGKITLNASAGNSSTLNIAGGDVTLKGGEVHLATANFNNRIGSAEVNRTLITSANIHGSGSVGQGQIGITNQAGGTIGADAAGFITLDASALGIVNRGTLKATAGATLALSSGDAIDNAGGTIRADGAGSKVGLNGATITGGTLATSSGGAFQQANGATAVLDGVALDGRLDVGGGVSLVNIVNARNMLTNNGVLALSSGTSGITELRVASSTLTLSGTGEILLDSTGLRNAIRGIDSTNRTLVNEGNWIHGRGSLGALNELAIINRAGGVIQADSSAGALTVTAGGTGLLNQGTLRASGGATLTLGSGKHQNDGTIEALNGSTVSITGTLLNRGTDGFSTTLAGGTWRVISTGATTTLSMTGGSPPPIATNAADVTLSGANSVFTAINSFSNNQGKFTLADGRTFTRTGAFANSGDMTVDGAASKMTVTTAYTQSAGNTVLKNGGMLAVGAGSAINGGTLSGNGTVQGNLTVNAGASVGPGNSPGKLSFTSNFTLAADADYDVQLAGTGSGQYDVIDVAGTATLANGADIDVMLLDAYDPLVGSFFDVIVAGSLVADISALDFLLPNFTDGRFFTASIVDLADGRDALRLTVGGSQGIPAPGGLPLVLLAAGAAVLVRRRTRG